jgi:cyclic lactone autoinducer peptide
MRGKKFLMRVSAFLIAFVPVTAQGFNCVRLFGEPKLPEKLK